MDRLPLSQAPVPAFRAAPRRPPGQPRPARPKMSTSFPKTKCTPRVVRRWESPLFPCGHGALERHGKRGPSTGRPPAPPLSQHPGQVLGTRTHDRLGQLSPARGEVAGSIVLASKPFPGLCVAVLGGAAPLPWGARGSTPRQGGPGRAGGLTLPSAQDCLRAIGSFLRTHRHVTSALTGAGLAAMVRPRPRPRPPRRVPTTAARPGPGSPGRSSAPGWPRPRGARLGGGGSRLSPSPRRRGPWGGRAPAELLVQKPLPPRCTPCCSAPSSGSPSTRAAACTARAPTP